MAKSGAYHLHDEAPSEAGKNLIAYPVARRTERGKRCEEARGYGHQGVAYDGLREIVACLLDYECNVS